MEKINFVNGQAPALNATNLNQMQDNIEVEFNNINKGLTTVNSTTLYETTGVTTETTMLETTVTEAGIYLFKAVVPINYYGQSGRELWCKLLVDNSEKARCGGIINTSAYIIYSPLIALVDVPANANIKVVLRDASGKSYACPQFTLQYIKLK